jgi:hypothetical protein
MCAAKRVRGHATDREDPDAGHNGRLGGRFAIASYLDHQADK